MEENTYRKVAAIYRKLKDAQLEHRVIYISGAVGFGKTSAVYYFFRRTPFLYISGAEGYLERMPAWEEIKQRALVFDDISWITDEKSKEYIERMVEECVRHEKQVVLIGRSALPPWLRVLSVKEHFVLADERELTLNPQEVKKLLEDSGVTLGEEDLSRVLADCCGHFLTLKYLCYHLRGGGGYTQEVSEQITLDLYHYYDRAFYEPWDKEMREILLAVCQYPYFTVELTEMVTGNDRVPAIFERAMSIGTFLYKCDEQTYTYREPLREYLKWKQSIVCSKKEIKENFEHGALYYELHHQVEQALYYYEKAGSQDKICRLLAKNAKQHPGTAHFYENRKYYLSLPEETVRESPLLMSGLSLLYDLILQADQSERWYQELQKYEQLAKRGSPEKKEAQVRLAYLDIALPHRGIHGLVSILKNAAILSQNRKLQLPEMSVTSNLPSIMNGGLDFCEWSRNDKELALLLQKPVELVLGKYGVGLVNIALAESGFEKGSMSTYEIMTRLNRGYLASETGGKLEMCFAAIGLMVREHLANGQPELGMELLTGFREKVREEGAEQLVPNLETTFLRLYLLEGNLTEVNRWMQTAPDENMGFCILERYRYISKVRCLIVTGQMERAFALIERLDMYFTQYERHYLWMENQILKAILLHRVRDEAWKKTLLGALQKGWHYGFVRIFAQEGAALEPLLAGESFPEIDKKYLDRIREETGQMASYYPNYLRQEQQLLDSLTEREMEILRLMCEDVTSGDICSGCNISYSGLKFHSRNIYRKLGVKNRKEAEKKADRLKLISPRV